MGLFKKKKKEVIKEEGAHLDNDLREDISKAYDELMSGGNSAEEPEEKPNKEIRAGSFEAELFKTKIKTFKEEKTEQSLMEVIKMLPGRNFFLPSVSNMKEPFERNGKEVRLKKGAVLNPALLSSKDKRTFLPVFTDKGSMTQQSPSGVVMQFPFEHCVGIVFDKRNPVTAIVINPFTENFIMGEDLLRQIFKEKPNADKNKDE